MRFLFLFTQQHFLEDLRLPFAICMFTQVSVYYLLTPQFIYFLENFFNTTTLPTATPTKYRTMNDDVSGMFTCT